MKKLAPSVSLALLAFLANGCTSDVVGSEEELRQRCGGIQGLVCPEGYTCIDDPRDGCDPAGGGADCGGICRRARRTRCDYNAPGKVYYGQSLDECSRIRFACAPGTEYFADDCGCGCQDTGEGCAAIGLCVEGYVWDETTCECVPAPGDVQCGGFAGLSCPNAENICVDLPGDGCDPNAGGADCIGVCRDAICSGQTARCAAGYYWSQYQCNCIENPCNVMDCAPGTTCEVVDGASRGECVPDSTGSDCRSTGCPRGDYCTFCWFDYACIPEGAIC
jgi:hypothetical protein